MKNASVTDEVKTEGMLGTNYSTEEFGVMWARILIKWIKCGNALKSIQLEPDLKPVLITRKVTVEGNRIPGWGFGTVLNLNLGYIPFSDLFAHIVTQMCHLKNTHCHCWNLLFSSSWGHLWDFVGHWHHRKDTTNAKHKLLFSTGLSEMWEGEFPGFVQM